MPAEENLLDRLMNEYGDDILRVCYLYLKDYHLAEDAVQETFIRAMRSYGSFGHRSKEKTWLTRIAVNCCKNMTRSGWHRNERDELDENIQAGEDDPVERLVEREEVSQGIMQLGADDREVIILYYYQELHVKEIASIIGKSENAAVQRLSRARKKLRRILEGES